jgi:hypothetical protein
MAIRTEAPDGGQFHRLTPRVMKWDETTYLLDLTPVRRYWSHHAEHQQQNLSAYLTDTLWTEMTQTQQAATAAHPWIALLLLSSAADRPTLKLVDGSSPLGRRLLDDLTCEQWINRVRELREPMTVMTSKGTNSTPKKPNLGSLVPLVKTIDRMGLKHIRELADIDVPAMERRFGKLAATAWRWTITNAPSKPNGQRSLFDDTFHDDFPWQNITPKETPSITRCFEHPLRLWDHISPHLMEDFDRICNLTCWSSSERVVSLEWELSFSCSPPLRIPVLFRHPHALHSESGHHKTALLQAFHSWQRAMTSRQKPCLNGGLDGDTYIVEDSITEWRLVITERLILSPQPHGLFADDGSSKKLSTDCSQLMRLENSLAVPLFAYTSTDHWTPERSFTADRRGFDHNHIPSGSIARLAMNQRRPLFIYKKPESPLDHAQSSGLIFSERVGIDWWSDIPAGHSGSCRDYYIRMTDDGLLQWVFHTDDGSIKIHGIYG